MRAIKKSNVAPNTKIMIMGDNNSNVIHGKNNTMVVGDSRNYVSNPVGNFNEEHNEVNGGGSIISGEFLIHREPSPSRFGNIWIRKGPTRFCSNDGKIVAKGHGTLDGIEIGPGTYWKSNGQVYRTLEGSQIEEAYEPTSKAWQKVK